MFDWPTAAVIITGILATLATIITALLTRKDRPGITDVSKQCLQHQAIITEITGLKESMLRVESNVQSLVEHILGRGNGIKSTGG